MVRNKICREKALTGLELVILIILFIATTALLLHYMHGGGIPEWIRTFPGGLVAESMYISGDSLQPVGDIYGFPSSDGIAGGTSVIFLQKNPDRLGAVKFTVSLFIGDTGAIDMDRVSIRWNSGGNTEPIRQTTHLPVICPNWTVSGKYNMLPGRTADSDNWLEPGEQFEIFACPSTGVPPYGTFTLIISPDGTAEPLRISRMVPAGIKPVMNLG